MNAFSLLTRILFNHPVANQLKTCDATSSININTPVYLDKYSMYKKENNKRLILIVTVGRSGSRWLAEIFNTHDRIIGSCERDNYAETFYKYVKWNDLPIDLSGVYHKLANSILNDWKESDLSVLASPPLSIDFLNICQVLEVDELVWAVNDAVFTITSMYNKGFYDNSLSIMNPHLALGYQPTFNDKLTRMFSRVIPRGDFFYTWVNLTRIGKISWYYNMINMRIFEQINTIDSIPIWIFKLEDADQNYEYYLKLVQRFRLMPTLNKGRFLAIKERSVNSYENNKYNWTSLECDEWDQYSKEFRNIYPTLKN